MSDRVPMTQAGYDAMKAELTRLKSEERPKNVEEIAEALAHGDLSENAEYHAAKERQGHIQGRIAALDDKLARAQVIEQGEGEPEKVQFGVTVVLTDLETDEEVTYRIVGEDEADPKDFLRPRPLDLAARAPALFATSPLDLCNSAISLKR